MAQLLTVGDNVVWAEPKQPGLHDSCVQCGRKVGKNSYWVEISIYGTILPKGSESPESQGCWAVGSECAKSFDASVLLKGVK